LSALFPVERAKPFFLIFATISLSVTAVHGQTRRLPRAQFPVLTAPLPDSNGNINSMNQSTGLHLTEGEERPRNQPALRYNPGEPTLNMATVRWENRKMPLLIWISPGLMLADCPFNEIQATRVDYVTALFQNPGNPFAELSQVKNWTPEVNDLVATGFEQWREFENEGLFHFAFTDDPRQANICVFFTPGFKDSNAPGGIMVGGITSAQIYPLAQAQSMKIRQKPVIIELSTNVNSTPERMIGASAHEFGHALGIKAHSPYREDIMYVDRVVNSLSPGDKSTIRWLYRQTPQYVM
jgi:predicted Zn-dependent protease